jgi:hypothetical protein
VKAPKSEIYEIRPPEFAFATFTFDGVTMRQKIGRWETDGMYEIWELQMEDGFYSSQQQAKPQGLCLLCYGGQRSLQGFEQRVHRAQAKHRPLPALCHPFFPVCGQVRDVRNGQQHDAVSDLLSEWESYKTYCA